MQNIIKYKADDGREFNDVAACSDYEKICEKVDLIMSNWPKHPENDGCKFANGHGYIQLSGSFVLDVRTKFLNLVAEYYKDWEDIQRVIKDTLSLPASSNRGIIGRYLDDSGMAPFYRTWNRFMCIDTQYREWGQSFFAINPDKGEVFEIAKIK